MHTCYVLIGIWDHKSTTSVMRKKCNFNFEVTTDHYLQEVVEIKILSTENNGLSSDD